jgi:chaperone BCS1
MVKLGQFKEGDQRWYSRNCSGMSRLWYLYPSPFSLSLSIAGEFGLDIYVVNLSSIDDKGLKNLFTELPPHCLILLEDIDAASSKRSEDTEASPDLDGSHSSPKQAAQGMVSPSTLLNVIDGVGLPEGRCVDHDNQSSGTPR